MIYSELCVFLSLKKYMSLLLMFNVHLSQYLLYFCARYPFGLKEVPRWSIYYHMMYKYVFSYKLLSLIMAWPLPLSTMLSLKNVYFLAHTRNACECLKLSGLVSHWVEYLIAIKLTALYSPDLISIEIKYLCQKNVKFHPVWQGKQLIYQEKKQACLANNLDT